MAESAMLVKVQLADGSQLYVEGEPLGAGDEEEHDIGGVIPRFDQVVQAVRGFAAELGAAVQESGPPRRRSSSGARSASRRAAAWSRCSARRPGSPR